MIVRRCLSSRFPVSLLLGAGLLLLAATAPAAHGAELRVSDGTVVVEDGGVFVEVDVSWRLSWRDATNWDAAWLFAEVPRAYANVRIPLSPTGHRMVQNRNSGQPGAAFASSPGDSLGVFVYRDAQTETRGTNRWTLRLRVALPDGVTADDLPETVVVHGLEMVHVPEGPFFLGDPQPVKDAPPNAFYRQTQDTTVAPPFRVTSSGAIPVCDGPGSLCYSTTDASHQGAGDQRGPIPASFPNGYDAFYLMKYEVTQGQYVDFLNSLWSRYTAALDPIDGRMYAQRRGAIHRVGDQYATERPDRACNFLSWMDAAAFADWAGLRPMTELEYEKAARGPADPVPNEMAWGSSVIAHGDTLFSADSTIARTENGREFVRGNANYKPDSVRYQRSYGSRFSGGDEGLGPLRVDIFETQAYRTRAENRREAGGTSYYGAQGLSGSLFDRVVTAADATGRAFRGTHGDGALSYPGQAELEGRYTEGPGDHADWPRPRGEGLGLRGGSAAHGPSHLRVAARQFGDYSGFYASGNMGFRGARTAPAPE
jgi:formylglycine-generating enzyme required for sulfatase activity